MDNNNMEEIQRTLGRLEGKVDQILSEQEDVRQELINHKSEDRQNFQAVSSRFGVVSHQLEEADVKRDKLFTEQNKTLNELNDYVNRVKGAWWLIGVLVAVIAGSGALLDWFLNFLSKPPH